MRLRPTQRWLHVVFIGVWIGIACFALAMDQAVLVVVPAMFIVREVWNLFRPAERAAADRGVPEGPLTRR